MTSDVDLLLGIIREKMKELGDEARLILDKCDASTKNNSARIRLAQGRVLQEILSEFGARKSNGSPD